LPGNNVAGNTLLLSLMRSARLISYGSIGGFEQGTSSDTGLQLGKRIGFDYALVPHAGTWQEARVYRAGLDFNNPLIARQASAHVGELPPRWGLVEISSEHVVLSALKPSRDGDVAVRVYEASGQPARGARMHFAAALASAREANLIEDPGGDIPVRGNSISFDLRPYEIKTFRFRFSNR
jgi:alpha-mannosidase